MWDLLLIRCERLVCEGRGNGGEPALLRHILVQARVDTGQESIGGCILREELDRLVGDGRNSGEPEFGVLVGEETCLSGICDNDVRLARLHVWPAHVDGIRPGLDGRFFVGLVGELGEARVLGESVAR